MSVKVWVAVATALLAVLLVPPLLTPGADSGDTNQVRALRVLVNDFPAQELEAAILSRLDHLTHPEIAEVMGVGERTVRRLLTRFDERVTLLEEDV